MTIRLRTRLSGLGLAAALALPVAASETKGPCCFNNPQYSGTCMVTPAKDETCGSILDYLNNPMAQGKGYCNGTEVRGHWTEVSCVKPSPKP